jgi:hypothetical protein
MQQITVFIDLQDRLTCFGQTFAHLQERKTVNYSMWYGVLLQWLVPRCRLPDRQPTTTTGHHNTCCNFQINKCCYLLHLVGFAILHCLHWRCTVKHKSLQLVNRWKMQILGVMTCSLVQEHKCRFLRCSAALFKVMISNYRNYNSRWFLI